jgi:hypothetical protein
MDRKVFFFLKKKKGDEEINRSAKIKKGRRDRLKGEDRSVFLDP